MEAMKCSQCGRKYATKSGLRRHMKAEHPALGEGGNYVGPSASDDLSLGEILTGGSGRVIVPGAMNELSMGDIFGPAELPKGAARKVLDGALKALGIEPENVLSYAVHDDRVVIIEGPVGYKRVYVFPSTGSGRGPGAREVKG